MSTETLDLRRERSGVVEAALRLTKIGKKIGVERHLRKFRYPYHEAKFMVCLDPMAAARQRCCGCSQVSCGPTPDRSNDATARMIGSATYRSAFASTMS